MRKLNKNSFVFLFAIVFVIIGFFGNTLSKLSDYYITNYSEMNTGGLTGNVSAVWNAAHVNSDQKLNYYGNLVDINSIKENIIGTRTVNKVVPLVKTDSGKLHRVENIKLTESDVQWSTEQIKNLQEIAEASKAKFLYCGIPTKGYCESMPPNVSDYSKDNYDRFMKALDRQQIPYIDFYSEIINKGVKESELFFNTDHHWRIYPSFLAYQSLCEQLNLRYGFDYKREYANVKNFSVNHYHKIFLGSWGQKLGTFFSWLGRDDFDLIIPRFDTFFVEEQPFESEKRSGVFETAILENYDGKLDMNGFNSSLYSIYGGNYRLQIIKNQLIKNGKKILMIRDSFAMTVGSFLATQVEEIHLCDVRSNDVCVGEKINIKEYISQIKPDIVIVLYSGAYSKENSVGYYDFF